MDEASVSTTDDYAREPVSAEVTSTGWHLALIIIGGTIGFSVFIVSAQIGGSLGYYDAGLAFVVGSLVLGTLGATTSYVGAKTRLSTYILSEFAFGRDGAKLTNLAVGLSLIGWYGVISNFLGQASQQILLDVFGWDVSVYMTVSIASLLMISVTVKGFKGIDQLAAILVPVMIAFILYAAYASTVGHGTAIVASQTGAFTFATAVSAVVGSYIAGVIIQPDYSRFAINTKHAVWSVFVALAVVFPLIQFFSAVPSMVIGEPDLLAVLVSLGLILPAFLLLFFGSWSSNVLCLYSSGLSFATMLPKIGLDKIIVAVGIAGTAIAFVPAQDYLVGFLVLLGVAIPPIGAIYIVEAAYARRFVVDVKDLVADPKYNFRALFSWGLAIAAGYLSQTGTWGLTDIASIDSLIVSFASFFCLKYVQTVKRTSAQDRIPEKP